jgi:hypothetical protein
MGVMFPYTMMLPVSLRYFEVEKNMKVFGKKPINYSIDKNRHITYIVYVGDKLMDAVMCTNAMLSQESLADGGFYHALIIILESCKHAGFIPAGDGLLWKQMVDYPVGQIPGNINKRKLNKTNKPVTDEA